ncbi:hypothetical protein HOE39_01735 [Candidatus Woesearchaeota archaeon]|jgi:hypothetical protein|nr:hypothetical protein [Candidatus Woesearchaeota archaeon]
MRKLYLLLLLIPTVFAQSPVFSEFGFEESELPFVHSNSFSLSEVEVNLEGETRFDIDITNKGAGPLFLIVDYPDFLSGETRIEMERTDTLQFNVDNSKKSFGIIEFNSPDASLSLPVINTPIADDEFDKFTLNPSADVYFAGGDMIFNIEIVDDNSEATKQVYLTLTLLSKDNKIVLEDSKIIEVDALFDEELSLYLPEYLSKGDYVLFVESKYMGFSEYDSSLFTLDADTSTTNFWTGLLLILIVGLFLFLIRNSNKHLGKLRKIHTKHSLSIRRHRATRAESELVEKKLSSIRSAYLAGAISKKNYESIIKKLRNRLKALRLGLKKRPKK